MTAGPASWRSGGGCPPLNRRQTARLSPSLQAAHERWQAEQLKEPPAEAQRRRGRQLALSLLELGEDLEAGRAPAAAVALPPGSGREAVAWATAAHRNAIAAEAG